MGRHSTGIETAESSRRIEMSYLIQKGYLLKGAEVVSRLEWKDSNGDYSGSVGIKTILRSDEKCIILNYTFTDRKTGGKENIEQKIKLVALPSNLGKGEVLYFECPFNYKLCRVLYNAYNSKYFKSRLAYRNRIYYNCQKSSKMYYALDRKHKLEKQLTRLQKESHRTVYKGNVTRKQRRINKMIIDIGRFDFRNNVMLFSYLKRLSQRVSIKEK